jgi:hypothetical protein
LKLIITVILLHHIAEHSIQEPGSTLSQRIIVENTLEITLRAASVDNIKSNSRIIDE